MPRNDQITRQWHLLRRLEVSNGLTLQQLVESVPEDFPKNARTVRRNLLKPLEGTEIQASLNSALSKASAALPPQGHEYVRALEQSPCGLWLRPVGCEKGKRADW